MSAYEMMVVPQNLITLQGSIKGSMQNPKTKSLSITKRKQMIHLKNFEKNKQKLLLCFGF